MFTTIVAKYACKCRRCNNIIEVGERMRYGGPGKTYHIKKDCPAVESYPLNTDILAYDQMTAEQARWANSN